MNTKPKNVTEANEKANDAFNGKQPAAKKRPEDAKDTTDANEAADTEFNEDDPAESLGNRVGGLRGSAD